MFALEIYPKISNLCSTYLFTDPHRKVLGLLQAHPLKLMIKDFKCTTINLSGHTVMRIPWGMRYILLSSGQMLS